MRRTAWLRRHSLLVGLIALAMIVVIFYLDATVHPVTMAGFYLIPLTLLALSARERLVLAALIICGLLSILVMISQGTLTARNGFDLLYGGLAGIGLVFLAYLIRRLSTISDYAILRAQLSEAGADILTSGGTRDDLDELLQYALERLGEQLDATGGLVLVLEEGQWVGRAGFGLGVDAREIAAPYDGLPLAVETVLGEGLVIRQIAPADQEALGPLGRHLRLERVLLVPMHALDRQVGVMLYNRPLAAGEFTEEQLGLAPTVAGYLAVAVDNVRLMVELSTKSRDLEMVRDSSLDFAQSLDMREVLEAVVARLVNALGMHACDVYRVRHEDRMLQLLVTYDDGAFTPGLELSEYPLDDFVSSAQAVDTRRHVLITSFSDPRLGPRERDLMERYGHRTQLSIPLRIRDRVLALVELFDEVSRELTDDEIELARTICRFAALAVDKAQLFDEQRSLMERRDRLARRLQRLQDFTVDLNRRLEHAEPAEVLSDVTTAALDLLHVHSAAVLSGSGEYLAARALAVAESDSVADGPAEEAALLERCRVALDAPADASMAAGQVTRARVAQSDGLLFAPLVGEAPQLAYTLVVADKQQGAAFDREDRQLLATLAAQLSASLHNATAYQREHAIAETFQQALLMEPPAIPGIEVGVRYRAATDAARVGGDFYDVVTLGPGRLMVIVGDVCGKSLAAAAQSAVVRYMLRAYAAEGSPGEALSRLNSAVIAQTPDQPFVTLVVAYLDVARHMFEYAVAGHPRPVVLAGHSTFPMPEDGNVPVGIFRGAVYPTNRAILPESSCVVLYTDGITDARRDGVLFGEKRLRETIDASLSLGAQGIADALLEAVKDYAGGVLPDDCAVVALRLP